MRDSRVLVIDDDEVVRALVRTLLERGGALVFEAPDGRAGLGELFAHRPDLVVLDVEMPDLDGWETLRRIRDLSEVPVLMLTARDAELEKVRGLREGADDYLTKPFGRQELLARAEALLRRAAPRAAAVEGYADAHLTIDFTARDVQVRGRPVDLTPLEFSLLSAFVRHPNQVLTRDQLLESAWGSSDAVSPDQVKLYVSYLRGKLRGDEGADVPIETVRGVGYRFRPRASS